MEDDVGSVMRDIWVCCNRGWDKMRIGVVQGAGKARGSRVTVGEEKNVVLGK
jgi:hypothetical protein